MRKVLIDVWTPGENQWQKLLSWSLRLSLSGRGRGTAGAAPVGSVLPGERLLSEPPLPPSPSPPPSTPRRAGSRASACLSSGRWFFVLRSAHALLSRRLILLVLKLDVYFRHPACRSLGVNGGATSDERLFFHLEERSLTRREDSVCASSLFSCEQQAPAGSDSSERGVGASIRRSAERSLIVSETARAWF